MSVTRRLNELNLDLDNLKEEILRLQEQHFETIPNESYIYLSNESRYKKGEGRFQKLWEEYNQFVISCRVSGKGIHDKFFELETIRLLFNLYNVQNDNPFMMYKKFHHRQTIRLNNWFNNVWNLKDPVHVQLDKLIDNQISFI